MPGITFTRATKAASKARIAFAGPAGSGKTYTALRVASAMGQRIALIDTEHGSASKYADKFTFDTLPLDNHHPNTYIEAIRAAEAAGYDVLIIDSISHEWQGKNGCLELVDMEARKSKTHDTHAAWAKVTPLHTAFIEAILGAKLHVIATMRSKMDYIRTEDEKGKSRIQKVGMAPITRDSTEYEFDILGELDLSHDCIITKTRCDELTDRMFHRPGEDLAKIVLDWLAVSPEPRSTAPAPATTPTAVPHDDPATVEPLPESESDLPEPPPTPETDLPVSSPPKPTPDHSDVPLNMEEETRRIKTLSDHAEVAGYAKADLSRIFGCVSGGRPQSKRTLHDLHRMNDLLDRVLQCTPPFTATEVLELIERAMPTTKPWSGPEYDYVIAMLTTTINGKEEAKTEHAS